MDSITELSKEEQADWHEVMLGHAYGFDDWEKARISLLKLLHNHNLTATESSIRSFLSCCAEAVSGGHPLPNLNTTLEEFYCKYGMESAKPL